MKHYQFNMNDLLEVQPVDGYVAGLLRYAKIKLGVNIDLANPTRGQRLDAALALHKRGGQHSSIEIMVGRRIDAGEEFAQTISFLRIAQAISPQDPREFYDGFAHQYQPKGYS